MLTSPDEELVRRDTAVPGLLVALDRSAFLETLRRFLPAVEGPAHPVYLLYKPGVSCLAAYGVRIDGRPIDIHMRAYRSDARPKLATVERRSHLAESLPRFLAEENIVFSAFPEDRRLRSLSRLVDSRTRAELLQRLFPERPELWECRVERLRYKPERRFVARLWANGSPAALLKLHAASAYPAAKEAIKRLHSCGTLRLPQRMGHSDRHGAMAVEWLPGRLLHDVIMGDDVSSSNIADDAARVGVALCSFHGQAGTHLRRVTREDEAAITLETAEGVGRLCPQVAEQAARLGQRIATRLLGTPSRSCAIHGDFYANQVLLQNATVGVLDLDEAVCGDPAADVGNFLAHLHENTLRGLITLGRADSIGAALCDGYRRAAGDARLGEVDLHTAAGLLRLAPHPFRNRESDWPTRIAAILQRTEEILDARRGENFRPLDTGRRSGLAAGERVLVEDPFGLREQPGMAFLAGALDPLEAAARLGPLVAQRVDGNSPVHLRAIRVTRLKPQRRCIIEYDWDVGAEPAHGVFTTVAKVRMKGLDESAVGLLESLWRAGFDGSSPDGVCVPVPIGAAPEWRMWLQSKSPGVSATELLVGEEGGPIARRIAEAIHKLHRLGPPPRRRHTMTDELRILHERLPLVAQTRPDLAERLDHLLDACDRLAAESPALPPRPIHRDFYADHVLVDGPRLCLLDLDLFCEGDPALDVGNFCGHLTEQSLRTWGRADRLAGCEQAMTDRFAELMGEEARVAVQIYATLTLVRHIHISTLFPKRRRFTEHLCTLCEERLSRFRRRRLASPLPRGHGG